MKNFLYTLIFLMIGQHSSAQTYYSHYLDASSEWRYYWSASNGNMGGAPTVATSYFDGSEIINDFVYYKFYHVWKTIYNSVATVTFIGYVREDPNGNFYRYNSASQTETLWVNNIYTINFNNGDLIPNPFGGQPCTASVNIIDIAGLSVKRVRASGIKIEGVGDSGTFCGQSYNGNSTLCSYSKQGSTINESCPYLGEFPIPVRVNLDRYNFQSTNFSLTPNPSSGLVKIEAPIKIETIELIDIQGRCLNAQPVGMSSFDLNLSNFSNGTYIIRIRTDSGVYTRKLVKK